MRAVVFDWDGTLVNSQTAYVTSWRVTLASVGYEASAEELRYIVGRTFPDALDYFASRSPIQLGAFECEWRRDFRRRLDSELDVYPDAVACARSLVQHGVPLAIATQSPRAAFNRALAATGLGEFSAIAVTRNDVAQPKPAPDLYLEVCRRLRQPPSKCLAIEDSLVGIASARAAGLFAVGIARSAADLPALREAADLAVTALEPDDLLHRCGLRREHV